MITVGNMPNNNYPIIPTQYYNPTYIPNYTPPTYIPTPVTSYVPTITAVTPASTANTSTTIQRTVYVNNGTGEKSLVMLTIDGGRESIASGERRGYNVVWKNISNQNLTNIVLRVLFPASMDFEMASRGSFKNEDKTLTLDIGTLNANEGGELFIIAHTKTGLPEQEMVVVIANLVYTDKSNTQNDALAYATHRVENNANFLGAGAFFSEVFPLSNIFGWLLLLILILIIILLTRYLYQQREIRKVTLEPPHPPYVG